MCKYDNGSCKSCVCRCKSCVCRCKSCVKYPHVAVTMQSFDVLVNTSCIKLSIQLSNTERTEYEYMINNTVENHRRVEYILNMWRDNKKLLEDIEARNTHWERMKRTNMALTLLLKDKNVDIEDFTSQYEHLASLRSNADEIDYDEEMKQYQEYLSNSACDNDEARILDGILDMHIRTRDDIQRTLKQSEDIATYMHLSNDAISNAIKCMI